MPQSESVGEPVVLRVYDITRGMASTIGSALLGRPLEGVWHSGIEVFGKEYFFSGGVVSMPAAAVEETFQMRPSKIEVLGSTMRNKEEFETFIASISPRFTIDTYDIINWNCNHFTSEVSKFLLGKDIPDYILNQVEEVRNTPMGRAILPLLQQQQQQQQREAMNAGRTTLWTAGQFQVQQQQEKRSMPDSTTPFASLLRDVCVSKDYVTSTKRLFLLTLKTIVSNLLRPADQRLPQHMTLKLNNEILRSKVLRIREGRIALEMIGFQSCPAEVGAASESTSNAGEVEENGTLHFSGYGNAETEGVVREELQQKLGDINAFLETLDASRGGASAMATSDRFSYQLQQLEAMGFIDRSRNLEALEATNGNINGAIDLLTRND